MDYLKRIRAFFEADNLPLLLEKAEGHRLPSPDMRQKRLYFERFVYKMGIKSKTLLKSFYV